ncbi:MAG: (d)CMP kinase [Verrucomicrobiae bacterium]|nr:(d)CMP kinase [Verrucomicrobiae bacterium]
MSSSQSIIIAIDGPSGSGKSTASRNTARRLGFVHVDTGAMYRAVTWTVLNHGIAPEDKLTVIGLLPKISVEPHVKDGSVQWWIDGTYPEQEIRSPRVEAGVSAVSAIPEVRAWCVAKQREAVNLGNVVMEGRDIGTVVFPDTPHKFFLTASAEVRAQRRQKDLERLQFKQSVDQVAKGLMERDRKDSSRAHSPLKMAEGATVIDTSNNTVEQTAEEIMAALRSHGVTK